MLMMMSSSNPTYWITFLVTHGRITSMCTMFRFTCAKVARPLGQARQLPRGVLRHLCCAVRRSPRDSQPRQRSTLIG
jgi:hypothetical protein